jgi:hypothetical protein
MKVTDYSEALVTTHLCILLSLVVNYDKLQVSRRLSVFRRDICHLLQGLCVCSGSLMYKVMSQVYVQPLIGAIATLRIQTVSFLSVRPSAWNKLSPTGRIFLKFDI